MNCSECNKRIKEDMHTCVPYINIFIREIPFELYNDLKRILKDRKESFKSFLIFNITKKVNENKKRPKLKISGIQLKD